MAAPLALPRFCVAKTLLAPNLCHLIVSYSSVCYEYLHNSTSTYFIDEAIRIENENLKPRNFVYVFGDDRIYLKNKTSNFSLNNDIKEINNSSEYFRYHIKRG
jgi:hypothetical protein